VTDDIDHSDRNSETGERLILNSSAAATLRERADTGAPEEVCGVLAGQRGGDDRHETEPDRVTATVAVDNVARPARTRYELDPEATLAAIERIEGEGNDVVGFYHSHPEGPPTPSAVDREAATWTGYVYLIVGRDALAAYRWTGERFLPVTVETVD
jgi:proteasome lid subunit RPN8/RPN11